LGVGRWPVYKSPPPVNFTKAENAAIVEFAETHPVAYRKMHRQFLAYRAIVRAHNKKAVEVNRKQLKALGYGQSEINQMNPPPESSP